MKKKDGFMLFSSHYDAFKGLTLEQKGILLDAIFTYTNGGNPEINDKETAMAFNFIKLQIDSNTEKYEGKCEKNRQIAVERERKKKERNTNVHERERTCTNVTNKDKDKDKESIDHKRSMGSNKASQPAFELPVGLPASEWEGFRKWIAENAPQIADDIPPDTYLTMKGWVNFKRDILKDILREINGRPKNLLKEYEKAVFRYGDRIWDRTQKS